MEPLKKVFKEIEAELNFSYKFEKKFNSLPEWLGVLREEYLEFEQEIFNTKEKSRGNRFLYEEALQVATMAIKGMLSFPEQDVPIIINGKRQKQEDICGLEGPYKDL